MPHTSSVYHQIIISILLCFTNGIYSEVIPLKYLPFGFMFTVKIITRSQYWLHDWQNLQGYYYMNILSPSCLLVWDALKAGYLHWRPWLRPVRISRRANTDKLILERARWWPQRATQHLYMDILFTPKRALFRNLWRIYIYHYDVHHCKDNKPSGYVSFISLDDNKRRLDLENQDSCKQTQVGRCRDSFRYTLVFAALYCYCFQVSFPLMNNRSTHRVQGYFTCVESIVWMPQCSTNTITTTTVM